MTVRFAALAHGLLTRARFAANAIAPFSAPLTAGGAAQFPQVLSVDLRMSKAFHGGSLASFRLYHTIGVEAADLAFAVANLAQHSRCMLSQQWRRQAV